MEAIANEAIHPSVLSFLPARVYGQNSTPWIPLSAGKSFKPLRFLSNNRGFVELLRMEPGESIPLHHHTGEIHAFNLQGSRQLCTGELIGPGDYVYEPAGNTDWWSVVGDTSLIVLIVVTSAVEYLGPGDVVTSRYDANKMMSIYQQYCADNGIAALDLVD